MKANNKAKRTELQKEVERAVTQMALPKCIPAPTVYRRTGTVGCVVQIEIANHVFRRRITRRRLIAARLETIMDWITGNDGQIALGKTVIPPDASYGWSSLDRLREAGRELLAT